jgi:pyruvate/2-oxoglutarate dehydrogenase complex dihydrolipoamide acyltransferase (E2) component
MNIEPTETIRTETLTIEIFVNGTVTVTEHGIEESQSAKTARAYFEDMIAAASTDEEEYWVDEARKALESMPIQ